MIIDEIKLEIKKQISKTNQAFTNCWGGLYFNGLLDDNIASLEKHLKLITRKFKIYNILSVILSTILIIFSMLKYFDIMNYVNMNKAGLVILFTIVFLINTYRFYKLKVNLENKIYLLNLLDKIDRKQID